MHELRLIDEAILELTERRRLLVTLGCLLGLLARRVRPRPRLLVLLRPLIFGVLIVDFRGFDAFKVHLLHFSQFHVRLRGGPTLTVCTCIIELIKVEIRVLQVLVDILSEDLGEVAISRIFVLLSHLSVCHALFIGVDSTHF